MIAAFVLRGRTPAVMATTFFALVALVMPLLAPIVIISTAVVGFITLRLGTRAGVELTLLSTVAMALLGLLLFKQPAIAVVSLVVWAPILLLGMLLRYSGSLSLTIQVALLVGILPLLMDKLFLADGGWEVILASVQQSLSEAKVVTEEEGKALVDWLNKWLTAFMAAGLFLQTSLALFLARSWQARLVNPGGFRSEFHELRVSRSVTYAATLAILLVVLAGADQWMIMRFVAAMLMVLFFLQGLAVLHALLARSQAGEAWLVGVYVLMLFALPYMAMTLAATGFADSWWNFRKADQGKQTNGPGDSGDNE